MEMSFSSERSDNSTNWSLGSQAIRRDLIDASSGGPTRIKVNLSRWTNASSKTSGRIARFFLRSFEPTHKMMGPGARFSISFIGANLFSENAWLLTPISTRRQGGQL